MKKPICPVDPTCTFWPKGQCDRPYKERNACWNCGREVVRDCTKEIAELKKQLEQANAIIKGVQM